MTIVDELRETDQRRRKAMIEADVEALGALLSDDLVWTHSSGRKDGKHGLLERIASRSADYLTLDVSDDEVLQQGDVVIHHGTLSGRVRVDGREKPLNNRFLSVWKGSGNGFELLAWQSTGF